MAKKRTKKALCRPVNVRELRDKFLIVCEGKKTEPNYFERFRVSKEVKVVGGAGDTIRVVKEALCLMKDAKYDQVWCVFDKDSFPAGDFNQAIDEAKKNKIQVAYSNEAFELWYLLHFDYLDAAIPRTHYKDMLFKRLGAKYKKNDPNMYEVLEPRQQQAIRNATKLLADYKPHHNPAKDNPCTTVHLLVQALNQYAV